MTEFIRYNNWANLQVLEACQNLSQDQLAVTIPGAYGTIRDTLTHIIRAEAGYLRLLTGNRLQPSFAWEDQPGLTEMKAFAVQVGEALLNAVHRVKPTDQLEHEWQGKQFHFQALAIFIQIVNHGIEHRTNITTILNQGQHTPPDVDGWAYLLANPERFGKT
jgi:uncharacterized damage-inducible protein DinB